jgi:DNA-binding response OmpR family regulator
MTARIVVADDDPILQRLLLHTLKLEGYDVLLARDGNEALNTVVRERPDLVILDVMMPGLNGFELCQALRERPDTLTLPIIMLSGLSDVQEKVSGLRAGADEYLTKPIDLRELTARVDALLKRNRLLRQSAAPRAGRVISVLGAKGGVGTTTISLNLAALLAKTGKQVAAAEIRPDFGTFAAQLKMPAPERNLAGLLAFEAPAISEPLVSSHLTTTSFGPRVLFGPQKLEEFCELEPGRIGAIVGRLVSLADYVVVDLPHVAGPVHETVVKNSGYVVLLLEPEVAAVAAAAMRLRQLAQWGVSGAMIKLLVVNRLGAMMLSLREIENRLERTIDGVAPPAAEALNIAVQYGSPLVLYQPDHVTSMNLADFVTRMTEKPVTLPK